MDASPKENDGRDAPKESSEIALDSLPYIDHVHPDYEAYALSLIEEEMQKMENKHTDILSYDANSTPEFKSSKYGINKVEYEALVARNGQPRNESDQIDFVQKSKSVMPQDTSDKLEWEKAIERAKIEVEYERLRQVNAELQSEYETSVWKHHTTVIESFSAGVKSKLEEQLMKVDQINAGRKEMQEVQAAPKLGALNQRWGELIHKNQHLARGVQVLQAEVKGYRKITGVVFQNEDVNMNDSDDDL